jgi:hypothetical protein
MEVLVTAVTVAVLLALPAVISALVIELLK